jgi:hypothetical protein
MEQNEGSLRILCMEITKVEGLIHVVRGHRVMLDSDLAAIYGVMTMRLNEQVRRNASRFPSDFMFQLTAEENERLISQIAISKIGRGGRRKLPLVFTQEGVAMLSSVLHSPRAIQANIAIMRGFVRLRETLSLHKELAVKLNELEGRVTKHDENLKAVFGAIRELMEPPAPPKKKIGS